MMDEHNAKHKLYADTVKGIHLQLRKQLRKANGNFTSVWKDHCQNQELLDQYADAMHKLSTDIWTKRSHTRIHWCYNTCMEYFLNGGLNKVREKEQRRLAYEASRLGGTEQNSAEQAEKLSDGSHSLTRAFSMPECCTIRETSADTSKCFVPQYNPSNVHGFGGAGNSEVQLRDELQQNTKINLPFEGKISLLDVGSCNNPFLDFDEFSVVGIDLCPAIESVFRCDFLQLEVTPKTDPSFHGHNLFDFLDGTVTVLQEESFHTVVFSLLLEYLPSPQQRWICCEKAHRLLVQDGLLIIVSPDSHHQQRNAPMMKSWKTAIESIGFTRWRYVKQEHLHCLAFRKTRTKGAPGDGSPEMLYIPQDRCAVDKEESEIEASREFSATIEDEQSMEFMERLNDIYVD